MSELTRERFPLSASEFDQAVRDAMTCSNDPRWHQYLALHDATIRARVAELERENCSLKACQCDGCENKLEDADAFCLGCIEKLRTQLASVTAERDALRARVAELEAKYTTAKLVQRGVEEGEFWYWNDDEHDCLDSLLCPVVVLPEKINEWKQKLATVTAELEAFIAGGVTEELLRRQGGYLKVGKGCVLVREDDWDALLADHLGDANNKVCIWTENKDGQYETACGQMHEFFDGGPKDNHLQFCGYCGKGLIEQRWNL